MKFTYILLITLLVITGNVNANSKSKNYKNKETLRQEYKCFIELVGGKKTIQFIAWKGTKTKTDISKQLSSKISMPNTRKKAAIYNIEECVKAGERFKSAQARYLEKDMAW